MAKFSWYLVLNSVKIKVHMRFRVRISLKTRMIFTWFLKITQHWFFPFMKSLSSSSFFSFSFFWGGGFTHQWNQDLIQGLIFQRHYGSSFENQSQFKYFNYYWLGPKPIFNFWLLPSFHHFYFSKKGIPIPNKVFEN